MEIYFTKHAEQKFAALARFGVKIAKKKVIAAVLNPDSVDRSRIPLLIAQSLLNKKHVLRVVYKKESADIKVITFYPGRKSQYEKR